MDRIGMSVACFEMSGFSIDVDKIFLAIRLDGDIPAVMFAAQLWSDLLEYRPTTLIKRFTFRFSFRFFRFRPLDFRKNTGSSLLGMVL